MNEENTVFHKIIRREIPANIVFEDERVIAFRDIQPVSSTHILIVPKKTIRSLDAVTGDDSELIGHIVCIAAELARSEGVSESGYRLVANTGERAGQSVFQLHFHLLGGRPFAWPPG